MHILVFKIVKTGKLNETSLRRVEDLVTFDAETVDDLRQIIDATSGDDVTDISIDELVEKLRESSRPCEWCTPPRLPLDGKCSLCFNIGILHKSNFY